MQQRPTARALALPILAAFAVVVVAFLGATLLSRHVSEAIRGDASRIAGNGAPSIERLAAIRTRVLDLQLTVVSLLHSEEPAREPLVDRARELLAGIEEDRVAYEACPTFPGEAELWEGARKELARYRGTVLSALDALARGDRETARARILGNLSQETERTSVALFDVIRLDSARVQELARHIESDWALANHLAFGLAALATLLALAVAILVHRAIRRYASLEERYTAVLKERADELEIFAARVAHDVMSPLGAASASIELAQRWPDDRARVSKALARSLSSVRRVAGVVQGLYEFARAGARPARHESSSASDAVQEIVEEMRPAARQSELELVVQHLEPVRVACSRGVLGSLLSNLLGNAIKYSGAAADGTVLVRMAVSEARARFEVEDHGPGITAELQASVFDPYVRGDEHRQPGLGLGLATVKRLSESHGGSCGVRSVPGRGSTFWFELPVAEAMEEPAGNQRRNETSAPMHS